MSMSTSRSTYAARSEVKTWRSLVGLIERQRVGEQRVTDRRGVA